MVYGRKSAAASKNRRQRRRHGRPMSDVSWRRSGEVVTVATTSSVLSAPQLGAHHQSGSPPPSLSGLVEPPLWLWTAISVSSTTTTSSPYCVSTATSSSGHQPLGKADPQEPLRALRQLLWSSKIFCYLADLKTLQNINS